MGKITAFCSKNTTEFSEISRWRWSECWGGDSPARHCRFVPATVKTVPANVGERHAAPLQRTAGGLCIFHSSFFSLQDSFPCAPPLQRTDGNFPNSIFNFPLPSRSSSTHNVINIFVLWKKHKNPRGNPKRSLIIPSRRDLTNVGKCDKIKAQRESGAFKNTDPVFGIARQDRFVADRLGTPAFAAGAPFFFRRGREENQNV